MKTIISGAEFWDFEKNKVFRGRFVQPFLREKDQENGEGKAGDVIGFVFEDADGEQHLVSNSHQIKKALESPGVGVGSQLQITFKGKSENSKGQPLNMFHVGELEPGDEGYIEVAE